MRNLYSSQGKPIAYYDETTRVVYLFNGFPVAYFDGDRLYQFEGKFLGWYWDGWIRNREGYCVFFTDNATGGPLKPCKLPAPTTLPIKAEPEKGIREIAPTRPAKRMAWSFNSDESFFAV